MGSSMEALTVGATGLSDRLFRTVPLLARKPPLSVVSVSSSFFFSSLFFSESRLRKIDFLRVATGRLTTGGDSTTTSCTGASDFCSEVRFEGEGERDGGALDSLRLKRFASDLDLEVERERS